MQTKNKARHVKAAQQWIVWRTAATGATGIEYYRGPGWTRVRADAKTFGSAAEACACAATAHISRK